MKLEINYRKKTRKNTDMEIVNKRLRDNQWIKGEIGHQKLP